MILLSNAKPTSSESPTRVVLVVEDEISIRWPLGEHLRQTGWTVTEASNATEAMQIINSGATIDIAFVDFRLPGGPTGHMFAEWLASVRPTVPVLLTSGLTSRAPGFIKGERRGYIAKPYAFSEVSRLLTEMLKPVAAWEPCVSMSSSEIGAAHHELSHQVLIVDDDVDAAVTLSLLLRLGGHATALAHDGVEALKAAAEFKPDIVLLDLGLPGMDGFEVAHAIRRRPELGATLLVALTGSSAPGDRLRCMHAGFDEHLTKPVDISMIELLLARLPERGAGGGTGDSSIASAETTDVRQ